MLFGSDLSHPTTTMFTSNTILASSIVIGVICYAGLLVYRLCFHPLANFPGPKLAAASLWYEFYYDVILRGKFMWKIQEMHNQYGEQF